MKSYFLYIITNKPNGTLYIGITNNLERRMLEHKQKTIKGFSSKYNLTQLIYFDNFLDVNEAIAAEKRLKGWTRKRKIDLITNKNPTWQDFSAKWF